MKNILYFLVCLLSVSCGQGNNNNSNGMMENDSIRNRNALKIETEKTALDSSTVEDYEKDPTTAQTDHIVKVYGEQWDFCDCIKKTDSIQTVIDSDAEISDSEFDNLMARFEEIDMHCKAIISSPNTTPEERKAHETRVKKCLRNK